MLFLFPVQPCPKVHQAAVGPCTDDEASPPYSEIALLPVFLSLGSLPYSDWRLLLLGREVFGCQVDMGRTCGG